MTDVNVDAIHNKLNVKRELHAYDGNGVGDRLHAAALALVQLHYRDGGYTGARWSSPGRSSRTPSTPRCRRRPRPSPQPPVAPFGYNPASTPASLSSMTLSEKHCSKGTRSEPGIVSKCPRI
jgi:hypothetical protein